MPLERKIMKSSFYTIIVTVTVFLLACGNGTDQTATAQQNDSHKSAETAKTEVNWHSDWDKGMELAKQEKKPVFVDFYADWCVYCKKMDKETFAASEIKSRLGTDWVAIRIDTEDKTKKATLDGKLVSYQELTKYYRVTGLPTLLFIDKEGKPVSAYPGFSPKEQLGPMLDYIKDELYNKDIKFSDYLKSKS